MAEGVGEEGGGEVAVRAVDEDAGAEEDGAVDGVVEGFGVEVVGGAVVVGPAFAGDFLGGGCFDLVEVEEGGEGEVGLCGWFCAMFGGGALYGRGECIWVYWA